MSRSSSVRSTNSSCLSTAITLDASVRLPVLCAVPVFPAGYAGPSRVSAYPGAVPRLRIALAQVNPTVGDLEGNARLVVEWTGRAPEAGASLVVFPEMMLTGYPVEDLALRASFVDASIGMLRA